MGIFKREKKFWLVDLNRIESIIAYFYDKDNNLPPGYGPVILQALSTINHFCSSYVALDQTPDKEETKVMALNSLGFIEKSLAHDNGEYHEKFTHHLVEYWSDYLENEDDKDVLSFLLRCSIVSGIFKFYYQYKKYGTDPSKNEEYAKITDDMLEILDNNGTTYDLIGYLNERNLKNKEDNLLFLLQGFSAICIKKGYRPSCDNKKLDRLFDDFEKNQLEKLKRGAYFSSSKYLHT